MFHKRGLRRMADQIELQKIHHCLRIIDNIKKQIGDEDAVCYVEKAMDLTRKWLKCDYASSKDYLEVHIVKSK